MITKIVILVEHIFYYNQIKLTGDYFQLMHVLS